MPFHRGKRAHSRAVEEDPRNDVKDHLLEPKHKNVNGRFIRDPLDPVNALKHKLSRDSDLRNLIVTSLVKAKATARKSLIESQYKILTWPVTLDAYYSYLEEYCHWIPQQSGNEAFVTPTDPDEYQEVYIRLCHFYYLIDQPISDDGETVLAQNDPWFRKWLAFYADYWGAFLDTPESFDSDALESFRKYSPQYEVENSMIVQDITGPNGNVIDSKLVPNNPSGWVTFNQFFARSLNGGLRPTSCPDTNQIVTSPADCTYMESYHIDKKSNVLSPNGTVTLKKFHKIGNINDLLKDSPYKDDFAGGVYVHYFLNTYSYHRFHAPVGGKLLECRTIRGRVYLDVKIKDDGQFDAPDSAEDGYEFFQSRGLTVWDTSCAPEGNVGLVACLPVGMAQVSSSVMTGTTDKMYNKGEEFGYFQFGGSDIILLFQKDAVKKLTATDPAAYLHHGTPVAELNLK